MKRRDFLKKFGIAGAGLVAAPALVNAMPKPKPGPYLVDPALFPNLNLVNNDLTRDDAHSIVKEMLANARPIFDKDKMAAIRARQDLAKVELENKWAEDFAFYNGKAV